jgi:hypothetical protein
VPSFSKGATPFAWHSSAKPPVFPKGATDLVWHPSVALFGSSHDQPLPIALLTDLIRRQPFALPPDHRHQRDTPYRLDRLNPALVGPQNLRHVRRPQPQNFAPKISRPTTRPKTGGAFLPDHPYPFSNPQKQPCLP